MSARRKDIPLPPPSPNLYDALREFGEALDAVDKAQRLRDKAREALEAAALAYYSGPF
jgi:hypothetical protein